MKIEIHWMNIPHLCKEYLNHLCSLEAEDYKEREMAKKTIREKIINYVNENPRILGIGAFVLLILVAYGIGHMILSG